MSALVFGHDRTVADWVGKVVGKPFFEPFTAFGVIDKTGKLTGGVVFTNYSRDSIELSLAGRGIVSRGLWAAVISYVFDQLACSRLQVHTSRRNKRVLRMLAGRRGPNSGIGFKYEGVARKLYGKDDGVCYALTDDDLPAFRKRWKI